MAEKTIKWQCASKNGKSLDSSSGVSFSIGGDTIPAHAKISKITVTVSLSVNQAKNPNRLYFLKANDGTVFFDGNPRFTEKASEWSNHDYYNGKNGVHGDFYDNLQWFAGKSSASLLIRANNSGKGVYSGHGSYCRGIELIFTYTDFEPTLVYAGNPIYASDYNQLQAAYPALGVSSGSLITKAQIDAITPYDGDVVTTSVGTVITADYFNNSVLKKI